MTRLKKRLKTIQFMFINDENATVELYGQTDNRKGR